jgi:hypothetical protein
MFQKHRTSNIEHRTSNLPSSNRQIAKPANRQIVQSSNHFVHSLKDFIVHSFSQGHSSPFPPFYGGPGGPDMASHSGGPRCLYLPHGCMVFIFN